MLRKEKLSGHVDLGRCKLPTYEQPVTPKRSEFDGVSHRENMWGDICGPEMLNVGHRCMSDVRAR